MWVGAGVTAGALAEGPPVCLGQHLEQLAEQQLVELLGLRRGGTAQRRSRQPSLTQDGVDVALRRDDPLERPRGDPVPGQCQSWIEQDDIPCKVAAQNPRLARQCTPHNPNQRARRDEPKCCLSVRRFTEGS